MLCDICKKNPATIHFTQIINGKVTEVHICEKCAIEKGLLNKDKMDFSIGDILSGFLSGKTEPERKEGIKADIKCSFCGMTYSDFQKTGKLGCSECYHAFEKQLLSLFRKVHGTTQHTGKIPKRISQYMTDKRQVNELRQQLEAAIKEERFEDAAALRDEIKKVQKSLENGKK